MERLYRDFGEPQGPIRCIILADSTFVDRPRLVYQCPEYFITNLQFNSFCSAVIPQIMLEENNITFNTSAHKVVGYPICLRSPQYPDGIYAFNMFFLLKKFSQTIQYEPVVKKLGQRLKMLEKESGFVSRGSSNMRNILAKLLYNLNTYRKATVIVGNSLLHLKVEASCNEPSSIKDHDVPVLLKDTFCATSDQEGFGRIAPDSTTNDPEDYLPVEAYTRSIWDRSIIKVISYIDGIRHVSKIASKANIEKNFVKACIKHLIFHKVVQLTPLLKYSNIFDLTSRLSVMRSYRNFNFQQKCIYFVRLNGQRKPTVDHVIEVLIMLVTSNRRDPVHSRFNTIFEFYALDLRKLIIFTYINGILRCEYKSRETIQRGCQRLTNFGMVEVQGRHKLFIGAQLPKNVCCLKTMDIPALETIDEE